MIMSRSQQTHVVGTGQGLPCDPRAGRRGPRGKSSHNPSLEGLTEDGGDGGSESRPWGWKTLNRTLMLHSLTECSWASYITALCLSLPFCHVAITEPISRGSCGKKVRSRKRSSQSGPDTESTKGQQAIVLYKMRKAMQHVLLKQRERVGAPELREERNQVAQE